ncbi:MAG: ATP-binding cassette domain-containing protein, partial [Desulfurococcaceae archaeon]
MILSSIITGAGYLINQSILRDIKLDLSEGDVVLIIGSSGSGKTTLLYTITGVLKHLLNGWVKGDVKIKGIDILNTNGFERIPSLLKIMMQDPERQLVFPTPLDELMVSYEILGYSTEEAYIHSIKLLAEIGLRDKENTHVEDLSTGMRRRLAISMLKIGDPPLILLDEPSANLDPSGIKLIRDNIKEWKRSGKTILITEHKAHYFLDLVDNVYVLRPNGLEKALFEEESVVNMPECRDGDLARGDMLLEFKGSIGYGKNPIVKDVEIDVRRGEIIVIVGPNGSGKTTFLRTLAGSLKPVEGEVKKYTNKIFYSPQNPDLVFIHRTVREELYSTAKKNNIS